MRGLFTLLFLVYSSVAMAAGKLPNCPDKNGNPLPVDNERVLHLKTSTPNQFHDRANIVGTLVGVFTDKGSHLRLDVFIGSSESGSGRDSDIEIVYNKAFGQIRRPLRPGMEVAACGDFINAFKQAGRYPASPVGAIIHWVHMAPRQGHVSGFMAIDGVLYGQTDPQDRSRMEPESFLGSFGFGWPIAN